MLKKERGIGIRGRVTGALLALLIAAGVFVPGTFMASGAEVVKFEDKFDGSSLGSGWDSPSKGKVADGVYTLDGTAFNTVKENYSGVTVSADVTVFGSTEAYNANRAENGTGMLMLYSDASGQRGYEFGVALNKSGDYYLRLYFRHNADDTRILYQEPVEKALPGVPAPYDLTIGAADGRVVCLAEGKTVYELEDATFSSGKVGVRAESAKAVFDDFTVRELGSKTVESLEVKNALTTVSPSEIPTFDLLVTYDNPFYAQETLHENSPGVTVSGLGGGTGNKTVTVGYGGKTTTFTVNVVSKPSVTLFSDGFENAGNWTLANTGVNQGSAHFTFGFGIADGGLLAGFVNGGEVRATTPGGYGGFDDGLPATAMLKTDKYATWRYFREEAAVTLVSLPGMKKTANKTTAEMCAVSEGGSRLRFRVDTDGAANLYKEGTLVATASIGSKPKLGARFTMAVEVTEGVMTCYYNGKMVIGYLLDESSVKVFPQLTAHKASVLFDNFKVTALGSGNPAEAKSARVVSFPNGSVVSEQTANVLDLSDYCLSVTYNDGSHAYIPITDGMVSGYDPAAKKTQTVLIKYGGITASLRFVYTPHLFFDEFTGKYDARWNMPTLPAGVSVGIARNKLHFVHEDITVRPPAIRPDIKSASWKNVSVSVDVAFDTGKGAASRIFGIMARKSSNGDYDYRLTYDGNAFKIMLYRHNNGKPTTLLTTFSQGELTQLLPEGKSMQTGTTYNLQIVLKGNVVIMYFEGRVLGVYVDDSADAVLTPGTAGLIVQAASVTVDNFTVDARGENNPVGLSLSGVKNNTFEIYEGQTVIASDYYADVKDADGTVTRVKLDDGMLSPYDNLKVGTQNIQISVMGLKLAAKVKVNERHGEINALSKDMEALNPDSLTLADKEKIDALQKRYDVLSGYEAGLVSREARENFEKAIEKIEILENPELEKYPVLFTDDFRDDSGKWGRDKSEGIVGEWSYVNGYYRHIERELGTSGTSLLVPEELYGEIVSVEADVKMVSSDMFGGVAINVGDSGYYQARISSKTRDEKLQPISTLQLYTKEESQIQIASALPDSFGVHIETGDWFNIKMVQLGGILYVYVNDVEMITYDVSSSQMPHTEGSAGIKPAEGDALFDNVRVRGTAKERPDSSTGDNERYITPTTWSDDFEDEKVGSNPSHWIESYNTDRWKVYQAGGRKAYGTKYTGGDTQSWIHVFDKNTKLKAKFMAQNAGKDAAAGFVLRMGPRTAYIRVGYDFGKSRWALWSERNVINYEADVYYAEKTFAFRQGRWYDIEITVKDQTASLKVDGETALEVPNFLKEGYGRVGVFSNGAETYIDDVNYTFPGGDIPQDKMIEYSIADIMPDEWSECVEIETPSNGELIGITRNHTIYSNDYGNTFRVEDGGTYGGWRYDAAYSTVLKLRNGKYMRMVNVKDHIEAQETSDNVTWTTVGKITDPPLTDAAGRQQLTFHVNTLTEIDMGGGKYRLFLPIAVRTFAPTSPNTPAGHYTVVTYSDDGGRSWTLSKTKTNELDPGYNPTDVTFSWAENKIIKCSDGTLRMYYSRNKWGCMIYTESKDGGETWEGCYPIPEMQCPMSSFAVYEDPYERGTYYMVWVNDTPRSTGNYLPRGRICLVRSRDGKNWEFLMNCERTNPLAPASPALGNDTYQILDPSLVADDKYLYISFGDSLEQGRNPNDSGNVAHNQQQPWFIRVEKSALQSRPWDASTIADYGYTKSMEITKQPQLKFGLNDLFLLNGGEVTLTAFSGEKTVIPLSDLFMWGDEVNTYRKGETTVRFYALNRSYVETTFSVVDKYKVTWNVSDGGTVTDPPLTVLDGDPLKASLKPDKGFHVESVTVNGADTGVGKGNSLTVPDVHGDLEIFVIFAKNTAASFLASHWWIFPVAGVVLAAAAAAAVIIVKKKKRGKPGPEPGR